MNDHLPSPFTGIKLVVWDLDDTLWRGTLEEGGISWVPAHERLVKALAAAGVVNSICSNNDPERAAALLRERGLWRLFVFPRIGWRDKAQMLGETLAQAGLRAADTLFIDDKARIRAEVGSRHAGLQVMDPHRLAEVDIAAIPVLDPELRRLERYRLLERKASAQRSVEAGRDLQFLRGSRIRVRLEETGGAAHRERIHELLTRTNQLNFTKRRPGDGEVDGLLADTRLRTGTVSVSDRFGDYGLTGFYALDVQQGRLLHFAFSCRVLNMGVEQFVWRHLGRPSVDLVGPVASALSEPASVDWIELAHSAAPADADRAGRVSARLLLKGGCDLLPMRRYLESVPAGEADVGVDSELIDVQHGAQRYGHSALSVLLAAEDDAHAPVLDRLPWLTNWRTCLFSGDHDWVCLSLWVDYACSRVRHHATGLLLPVYQPLTPDLPARVWKHWWGAGLADRAWFDREFVAAGPIQAGELREQLVELRHRLPARTHLVVMNGAEVERGLAYAWGGAAAERNRALNVAVDGLIGHPGLSLLDVRRRIRHPQQVLDMQTHFSRRASFELAADLRTIVSGASRQTSAGG